MLRVSSEKWRCVKGGDSSNGFQYFLLLPNLSSQADSLIIIIIWTSTIPLVSGIRNQTAPAEPSQYCTQPQQLHAMHFVVRETFSGTKHLQSVLMHVLLLLSGRAPHPSCPMQTHTAGLNIMPAGTCLPVLCFISNNYNMSLPLKFCALQITPLLYCIDSNAASSFSPLLLYLLPHPLAFATHWLKYWFGCVVHCTPARLETVLSVCILYTKLAHTGRAECVACVCLGQWGSVCLAACHLLGQWAHWSPGSCRCRLLSVWQVINRAQYWTPTLLAAVPTVLQSWTHTSISMEPAECVLFVCVLLPWLSCTQLLYTLPKHRGHTPTGEQAQLSSLPLLCLPFFGLFA